MAQSLTEKILAAHLAEGRLVSGEEIGLQIDHTLTQDSTGTLAYLEFEAMRIPKVKTKLSLSFVDHNMLQNDFRNADDHRYLQSVAAKYGIVFSRPGNGICHQLYLERFARPAYTLLGSDSHTPTAGGMGMIAIGAGGLDVAVAMAGEPFFLEMPSVLGVKLTGVLQPFVSAKDVILEVLRRLSVKGGVNKILEYFGSGVKGLSVPERGTIANMGTETGATTSIFPSDEMTRVFLRAQGREGQWVALEADGGACYSEVLDLDLDGIEPLVALPHSPDNVKAVSEIEGTPVDQVCIGSCTNSSLRDLKVVAALLKGKKIADNVSLTVSPGSRQVLENLAASGELVHLIKSGARILENACGPCIGVGQAPPTGGVSLRTFNRNFRGRSGTQDAEVFLVSPETAVASALSGEITDPRRLGRFPQVKLPDRFIVDDSMFIFPSGNPYKGEVVRGPNIKPLPPFTPLPRKLCGEVLLKLGDNVTTDDILPGGSEVLSLRSNIPEISKHVFRFVDSGFAERALAKRGGFIVAGENYGQGSSREHAALAPRFLGVRAVLAKSFARIHLANLVNFGILPLTFADEAGYDGVAQGEVLELDVSALEKVLPVKNIARGLELCVELDVAARDRAVLKAGGKLVAVTCGSAV
ncbi:MAG: aconitate hydratase [Candidatus Bathyarchaeota archaeon]|nr:aconitate hydratase [Candidatus Bathyarchaeota archaeon]